MALFERVFEYLDLPVDLREGRHDPGTVRGEVRFEDVWFAYDEEPTLRGVDLDVPAGSKLALVGETGSGKTTLGYLAARLYDPERGRVTLDGVDLRDLRFSALADAVGVVSQETYLFHASVRENLRFARSEATDEEIEAAARAAQIHDTIAALPDGYDTVVGEALEQLEEGRTTIVIAHRLSTVRDADQIAVLDGGAVVERGTYAELLAAGGRYAELVARDGGIVLTA